MPKNILTVSFLVVLCLLAACSPTSSPTTTASKAKHQTLTTPPAEVPQLATPGAPEEPTYCTATRNSKDYLKLLDIDLNALKQGNDPCGSFTDWFVINLWEGNKAGIPKAELNARVERLIKLAEQGKFLSSYERALYEEKKAAGIREYIKETAGI